MCQYDLTQVEILISRNILVLLDLLCHHVRNIEQVEISQRGGTGFLYAWIVSGVQARAGLSFFFLKYGDV